MANPLQPKCIKVITNEYNGVAINLTAASVSGHSDIIACIKGDFWAFEVKYKNDMPSELQKEKINRYIDAGGKAFFIRSVEALRLAINGATPPIKYELKKTTL